MLNAIVAPFRRAAQSLVGADSPSQLAVGFTLGMILGVMPKNNLIALSLCVLLFSLRCNQGLGLLAAVVFSCIVGWTDPMAHAVGSKVLTAPSLQANFAAVYQMPTGSWLGFHNTVACGSLLLGVYAAYPAYWTTKACCTAIQRRASR